MTHGALKMSATQLGVQAEESVRTQNLKDRDSEDEAKERAEFERAPIKGFEDLPADHPMALRNAAMAAIEAANAQIDEGKTEDEVGTMVAKAIETAANPGIEAFTDPPAAKPPEKAKPAPTKAATEAAAQAAAQTKEEPSTVLDVADLAKYQVRVKVDGVEELQPADKVFRQFQKGAAADVRLAKATAEAKAIVEEAQKKAQQLSSSATTATDVTSAQEVVKTSQAATQKFKEASEALYAGNSEEAAELFASAVSLAQTPSASGRADGATPSADLVSRVTEGVTQQLSQQGALKQLFTDYPDIKSKKAFALLADEYAGAFMANGDDVATAIQKAGEAIGEEYKLGKWAPVAAAVVEDQGRPMKSTGPTTRAEKLSAKDELDNIQSGNARASTTEAREQTVLEQLEEMRKGRPGQ
jgi:hypothetical protein